MNDLTLQKARAYEAEHGAAISSAERPAYHLSLIHISEPTRPY